MTRGMVLYDEERYELALIEYKKALEIKPKDGFITHEVAMAYYQLGNNQEALNYAKEAGKEESESGVQAVMLIGTIHDNQGNTKKAIKTYKKSIKRFGDYYLLWFNLGVTYNVVGDYENAAIAFENAVKNRLDHANSHHALASMKLMQGKRFEALLPLYFYLLLMPQSELALKASTTIEGLWSQGVSIEDDVITLNVGSGSETVLGTEMLLSSIEAEVIRDSLNDIRLINQSRAAKLFTALADFDFDNRDDFYTQYYITLFSEIGGSEHMEAFANYTSQPLSEEARDWVGTHTMELREFFIWLDELD
tara:strand:- start:360 stop:1280 length:921 start_codon:yes stop_codon:yes gene_type:complete